MSLTRDFEKGIAESAKLCLSYLNSYKKSEQKYGSGDDYCLDKALGCLDYIDEWFEKATNFRASLSDKEFAKLTKVREENRQKCISMFAALGFDTSEL